LKAKPNCPLMLGVAQNVDMDGIVPFPAAPAIRAPVARPAEMEACLIFVSDWAEPAEDAIRPDLQMPKQSRLGKTRQGFPQCAVPDFNPQWYQAAQRLHKRTESNSGSRF
jgi:hypothetical protein